MNSLRAIAAVIVFWSSAAWGATLTWEANTESDLAGYHVYRCSGLPCTKKSGSSRLITLGKETSLDIGSPAQVVYYFITAYNEKGHESRPSKVAVFIPAGTPPAPPAPGGLSITVVP
ncbi:MAG TPA: hypothetical protein VLL94_01540 [Nitrospiraceae bacterium]|nr:hypothetical protein [Nitrospiraceae bacterium]